MRSKAWAPGHATFFFAVPEKFDQPLKMGSIGGGLNFASGVTTAIDVAEVTEVYWNHRKINGNVTITALEIFKKETGFDIPVRIDHYSELKIGHGLSTSGAGALGTVIALNNLANTDLNDQILYQMAHIADATNRTGLGSVIGQITSGIELRLSQGGPGIGKTKYYRSDDPIAILMMGELDTSEVLVSEKQMRQVTTSGIEAVRKAKELDDDILANFFTIGQKFTSTCGLQTETIKSVKKQLNEIGEYQMTMAMIGETLIIRPNNPAKIVQFARKYDIPAVMTSITSQPPSLIQNST